AVPPACGDANAACIIVLKMGPAIWAPVVSDPSPLWAGTTTATATFGLSAGAKPMSQLLLPEPVLVWAVPVLAATWTLGRATEVAAPPLTPPTSRSRTGPAVACDVACCHGFVPTDWTCRPSWSVIRRTA